MRLKPLGTEGIFSTITLSEMTEGSVIFAGAGGLLSQDNSNFFWNNSSKTLSVVGAITVTNSAVIGQNSVVFQPGTNSTTFMQVKDAGGTTFLLVDTSNKQVEISNGGQLVIDGTIAIGLDMSGGTFATAVQNWPADPVINAAGTQIIRYDDINKNMYFGTSAFQNNAVTNSLGFGFHAGLNTNTGANFSIFIGSQAGEGDSGADLTGSGNVGIGYQSCQSMSTGYDCVGLGYRTLFQNRDGFENLAIGKSSMVGNI